MAGQEKTEGAKKEVRGDAKREFVAMVTSDKMQKTRVVMVTRRVKDMVFKKYVTKRIKYKAHDEKNETHTGDKVLIVESRPLSRDKRWRIVKLLEKAVEA